MDNYPLLECRDCINKDGCELIPKINDIIDKNSFLDLSGSACDDYTTEHVIDNNWTAYTGNSPAVEDDYELEDEPTVGEMFDALEDGLEETIERGFKPIGVHMSFDTMQLFLEDGLKGSTIKNLTSKKYGDIKVGRDDSMLPGIFALSLYLEEEEDEDEDGDI